MPPLAHSRLCVKFPVISPEITKVQFAGGELPNEPVEAALLSDRGARAVGPTVAAMTLSTRPAKKMDFRRSGPLDERRRRVLMDEIASPTEADSSDHAAGGSAKGPVRAYQPRRP